MCANYRPPEPRRFRLHFDALDPTFEYKDEAYPGYMAPMLVPVKDDPAELMPVRAMFGMVPYWSKDTKISRTTYNARSETVSTKNSFRGPWKRRQFCLVPVDAFYEPNYESGKPIRWAIKRKDGLPFALAGICEVWKPVDGEPLRSFSMLTINATDHPLMKHFHAPEDEKRSIVYVAPDDYAGWLSAKDDQEARSFLNPLDPEQFTAEAAPKPPRAKLAKVVAEDRE